MELAPKYVLNEWMVEPWSIQKADGWMNVWTRIPAGRQMSSPVRCVRLWSRGQELSPQASEGWPINKYQPVVLAMNDDAIVNGSWLNSKNSSSNADVRVQNLIPNSLLQMGKLKPENHQQAGGRARGPGPHLSDVLPQYNSSTHRLMVSKAFPDFS
jgi:hypothetical protein